MREFAPAEAASPHCQSAAWRQGPVSVAVHSGRRLACVELRRAWNAESSMTTEDHMKAVVRAFHPISVEHVLDGTLIELRIHGEAPWEDVPTLLDAAEARTLAQALHVMAERLGEVPATHA